MTVGDRIFQLKGREKTKEFADKFGITASQVSRYLANESTPSLEVSMLICDYYGCSLDWLLRGLGSFEAAETDSKQSIVQEQIAEYVPMSKYIEVLEENRKLLLEQNEKQAERLRERQLSE